jgi:hypothetical protein
MAFVVPRKRGGFEVRESRTTPEGPRSRTLISFHQLTDELIEKAREKAEKPPSAKELRRAARRVGAPVVDRPVDEAARRLITEIGKGRKLDPTLRHLLIGLLRNERADDDEQSASDSGLSIAPWIAATPEERGRALVDLLLLADAVASKGRKGQPLRFPPLNPQS